MVLQEIGAALEGIKDTAEKLNFIDFDFPTEPREDAAADDWRDYALDLADKLAEAEKVVRKAVDELTT